MSTQTPKFYVKNTTTANTINIYRLVTGAFTFQSFVVGDDDNLVNKPIQELNLQVMPIGSGTFHVNVLANANLCNVAVIPTYTIASNKTENDWILLGGQPIQFNQLQLVNTTTTSFTLVLGVWGVSN
jgi:hypothetical protein